MNAPMELRIPPHSIEAEQSVLGALLIGGEKAWDAVSGEISDADFYPDDHRRIFRHIRQLFEAGKPVDVLTVSDSIVRSNEVEQTNGGMPYLAEMAAAVPSVVTVRHYARIVTDRAKLRQLIGVADEIIGMAWASGNDPADARIESAAAKVMALQEGRSVSAEPKLVSEIAPHVVDEIDARMDRGGEISGLATGFVDLDEKLDGLKKGDLIVLAGRPSMGKSALMANIAENVVVDHKSALVFSLEMSGAQLVRRSLSSLGRINSKSLASGRMSDEEWDRLTAAWGRVSDAKYGIDETPGISVAGMHSKARRWKRKHGLDLIIVDYLQLISGAGDSANDRVSGITRGLKLMARDLDVPVIALSQLSRAVEARPDKRPLMSDLRDSGSIEQDADVVLMLYRDEYYNPDSAFKGLAECLVRKNRMGEIGDIMLAFQPECSRFASADQRSIADARSAAYESKQIKNRRGMS